MRQINTFLILLLTVAGAYAQPIVRRGLLRSDVSIHRLSDDGARLAFMNKDSANRVYYSVLDLAHLSVKNIYPHPCLAYNSRLDGELKGYFVNNTPGWRTKMCPDLDKTPWNYTSTYYGTVGSGAVKQFADTIYALGLLQEGLLVSTPTFTEDAGGNAEISSLVGLRIINPTSGALVRMINTDTVIGHIDKKPLWTARELFVANERYLQVRPQEHYYRYIPLHGGPSLTAYYPMVPVQMMNGLAVYNNFVSGANSGTWLKLYDVKSSKPVIDSFVPMASQVLYCTVKDTVYHYRSDQATLYKELLSGGILSPIGSYRMDTTGATVSNNNGYVAYVGRGKLVVFPNHWRRPGAPDNALFVWDILSGRLLLKITDMYSPDARFLAIQDENKAFYEKFLKEKEAEDKKLKELNRPKTCEELWKAAKFHPGDYIRLTDLHKAYDYEWALVTGYDCNTRNYTLVTSPRGAGDETHTMGEDYFAGSEWVKGGTPYVRCPECEGNSRWTETYRERVGWEQVNFNVYVKDDRKTQQVTREFICQRCKGNGWIRR